MKCYFVVFLQLYRWKLSTDIEISCFSSVLLLFMIDLPLMLGVQFASYYRKFILSFCSSGLCNASGYCKLDLIHDVLKLIFCQLYLFCQVARYVLCTLQKHLSILRQIFSVFHLTMQFNGQSPQFSLQVYRMIRTLVKRGLPVCCCIGEKKRVVQYPSAKYS